MQPTQEGGLCSIIAIHTWRGPGHEHGEGEGQVCISRGHPSAGQDGSWQHYSTIGMTGRIPFPTSNPDTTYIPTQSLQSLGGCPFVHKLGRSTYPPHPGPHSSIFHWGWKSCNCLWPWGRYYCPPITDGKQETREGLVSGRAGGLTLKPILSPPWCAVPPPLRSSWVSERGLRVLTSPGMPFPLVCPGGDQEPSLKNTDLYFKGQFLYGFF